MTPLLLRHYRVRFEPPEGEGEEALVFTSEGKRLVVRGRALGLFLERVVPLLDGRHTLEEIELQTADVFDPRQLQGSLALLLENGIVEDMERLAIPVEGLPRLGPQIAYLREVSLDPAGVLEALAEAQVTVMGLGALGITAAAALAAANVGRIRCVDAAAVSDADPFLAQLFGSDDVGRPRVEVARDRIRAANPATSVDVVTDDVALDQDVAAAIEGSGFVLGCLDPGQAFITYKLNRACLALRIPWSSAAVSAFEGVVGPTVIPYETACYVCYQMRAVACRDEPGQALEELHELDRAKTDTSPHRENLSFGAGIVGNLLALEAFKQLTGVRSALVGRILTVDFWSSTTAQHIVLRKPWCPDCFGGVA